MIRSQSLYTLFLTLSCCLCAFAQEQANISPARQGGIISAEQMLDVFTEPMPMIRSKGASSTKGATLPGRRARQGCKTIELQHIYFAFNESRITKESHTQLQQLAKLMQHPAMANHQYVIIGHTDSDGSPSYNQRLSKRRAQAVKEYLVHQFYIDQGKLRTEGRGESEPIMYDGIENKQQSRRVEFKGCKKYIY